jgi:hypothetical protein
VKNSLVFVVLKRWSSFPSESASIFLWFRMFASDYLTFDLVADFEV